MPYVEANLTYIVRPTEKPINYAYETPPDTPQHSATPDVHTVPIYDGRAIASEISLGREGFALLDYQTAVRDFYDDEEVLQVYYPEAEQFVKEQTGAVRVVVFDHCLSPRSLWCLSAACLHCKQVGCNWTGEIGSAGVVRVRNYS